MTDPTLDPRESRLDDVDAPREDVDAPREDIQALDEPLVNLDATDDEVEGEESADDKYIQVIDGRPETLGVDVQDSPRTGPLSGTPTRPGGGTMAGTATVYDAAARTRSIP